VKNWLEKINQPQFDQQVWEVYWQNIAQDIASLSQIDQVFSQS
jgi:hypothetical protein